MLGKIKEIGFHVRNAVPSLDQFLLRRLFLRMGEEARLAVFSKDDFYRMAYELYCSSLYCSISVEPDVYQKSLIDSIIEAYFLSRNELENNPQYQSFIGGEWEGLSRKFSDNLQNKDDIYTQYLSLGSRSYKSLRLVNDTKPYRQAFYLSQVILTCMNFNSVLQKAGAGSLKYEGYHQFNYPHFYYNNIPLNLSVFSYEMTHYIQQKNFLKNNPVICEIGTGDGFVAREIIANIKGCKYILFDLPETLTRSHFLLSTKFPDKKIASLKELKINNYDIEKLIGQYEIIFLPAWHVNSIPESMQIDLWLNTHSFGEMPVEIAKRYCEVIDKTGKAFISINRDRDIPFFDNHSVIHNSRKFFSVFEKMKVRDISYPITSNYMTVRPSNVRVFFES